MGAEHLFLCGGAKLSARRQGNADPHSLCLNGSHRNVTLRLWNISEPLVKNIPDRILDLLDLAAYVYAADQSASRGGRTDPAVGAHWHRTMRLVLPVRDLDFWRGKAVKQVTEDCLSFLSDEVWDLTFQKHRSPPPLQTYFDFGPEWAGKFDGVVLFSGGLDSFAGVVHELEAGRKRLALVSHRSNPKTAAQLTALTAKLRDRVPNGVELVHIPVWASKSAALTRDTNQRTRSFLYAVLGIAVATMVESKRLLIYENGVVTFNLPINAQLVGGRASRSTHPCATRRFEELFRQVGLRDGTVENGFLWKTKAEIVRAVAHSRYADLIRYTESCGGTFKKTRLKNHCGVCSQCIDRRFAVLATGAARRDPQEMYEVDLISGKRRDGVERTMFESYTRTAQEFSRLDAETFCVRFPEVSRAVACLEGDAGENAQRLYDLHHRHGEAVTSVLAAELRENADAIARGVAPESLAVIVGLLGMGREAERGEEERATFEAITHEGKRKLGPKGYESLVETSSEYEMFIDGFSRCAEVTHENTLAQHRLTGSEFDILMEYITTRKSLRPSQTKVGGKETPVSAPKMFEKARRKVDVHLGRQRWRAFETQRGGVARDTAYRFAPPKSLRFCVIRPLQD